MSEYNIEFAKNLITAAKSVVESDRDSVDAQRAILYLSLLSCEISLKAFLEKAGMPIKKIKALSHNFEKLLNAVRQCEVNENIVGVAHPMSVSAARVCAITIDYDGAESTLGAILLQKAGGASKYPNEIRYGSTIVHAPCGAMLQAADKLWDWVNAHVTAVRWRVQPNTKRKTNKK